MSTELNWRNDWRTLIESVASALDRNVPERVVAAQYAGQRVVWVGTIDEKDLLDSSPGVRMSMPVVTVSLSNGRRAQVDHLFLFVDVEDVKKWNDAPIGSTVMFETEVDSGNEAFSGITWTDLTGSKCLIMVGTRSSKLLKILRTVA
jgi:hypothetical protein